MGTNAQQKLDTLLFWNKHGLNATRDAFQCEPIPLVPLAQGL